MDQYEVTKGCYVPVGTGLKFKPAGSVVTLDSADAEDLARYVKKASKAKLKRQGRSELNTPRPTDFTLPAVTSLPVPATEPVASALDLDDSRHDANVVPEEVTSDAGEPSPDDERVGTEAGE